MEQLPSSKPTISDKEKAKWWDAPRVKYPTEKGYYWVTAEGEKLELHEMKTWHIFNALRMIWNHTVPYQYRLIPYKPYTGIDRWPKQSRRRHVRNLYTELCNRDDITKRMQKELETIARYLIENGVKLNTSQKLLPPA
jgi:hypothetical protein